MKINPENFSSTSAAVQATRVCATARLRVSFVDFKIFLFAVSQIYLCRFALRSPDARRLCTRTTNAREFTNHSTLWGVFVEFVFAIPRKL